ncbi:MAG: hypothetical protein Ct9H300mP11_12400 [Chloroflexota bacterium]|nr:MAG: hypothetical protein Ct9H300mP11_12400 [Chloroflexota bacterium]
MELVPEEFLRNTSFFWEISEDNRHARAAEVLDAVLKIWEADGPLDYQGEFISVKSPTPISEGSLGAMDETLHQSSSSYCRRREQP